MTRSADITGARYVLAVRDLTQSARYYAEELGLTTVWSGDGWHFLRRANFFVMLGECRDDVTAFETNNHSYFAYLDVENIDALYLEYSAKKVEIRSAPANKPWGQREFSIRTIDGHRITFGESTNLKPQNPNDD